MLALDNVDLFRSQRLLMLLQTKIAAICSNGTVKSFSGRMKCVRYSVEGKTAADSFEIWHAALFLSKTH